MSARKLHRIVQAAVRDAMSEMQTYMMQLHMDTLANVSVLLCSSPRVLRPAIPANSGGEQFNEVVEQNLELREQVQKLQSEISALRDDPFEPPLH